MSPSRAGLRGFLAADEPAGFLVDPTHPAAAPFLTRPAAEGTRAYIEPYPATNLGYHEGYEDLKAGVDGLLRGESVDPGPHFTFINDEAGRPSPYQPLTRPTAAMVAGTAVKAGFKSLNVNSTTGGRHAANSRHYKGQAVDINQIDGFKVSPSGLGLEKAVALQQSFRGHPDLHDDLGPAGLYRSPEMRQFQSPSASKAHATHVHISSKR